jgi:hypothetical protein
MTTTKNRVITMSFSEYKNDLTFEFSDMNSEERLYELILYISDQCINDRFFGATKLNKILYFSDFLSFKFCGKPITGVKYQKLPQGPAPKRLLPVRERMIKNKDLIIKPNRIFENKEQHRSIALRPANLSLFTASEISIVDQVIRELWDKNANEVSLMSHDISWEIYAENDPIPYEAVHLSNEINDADVVRAHELIEKYGWEV